MINVSCCQACRKMAPTRYCEFTQGIGMLVVRSSRSIRGNLCRDCASKYFWEMTGLTLLTGWWGMISFVMNIIYIISNVAHFAGSRSLQAPASQGFAVQTSQQAQFQAYQQQPGQQGQPNTPAILAGFKQDIAVRLRSGVTPQQIAQFIAPRAGIPVAAAMQYVDAVAQGRA